MNKINYQKELDKVIEMLQREDRVPKLLMHSCCAPCSSYCLSYLAQYFHITVYYYNPNITESAEYQKRVAEQQRLLKELPVRYPVSFVEGEYEPEVFLSMAQGMRSFRRAASVALPAMSSDRERRHSMRSVMGLTIYHDAVGKPAQECGET